MAADNERQLLLVCSRILMPSTQRKLACAAILASEMFERIACYSLSGSLSFLSMSPFCWTDAAATLAGLLFAAIMYATGLVGGWIADSYIGRYRAIIVGYFIYMLGYCYLPFSSYYYTEFVQKTNLTFENDTCIKWNDSQSPFFCNTKYDGALTCDVTMYPFSILIAIGAGVVRTNLIPFGGDQARGGGAECTQQFFTAYYWFINIGVIIAFVGIAFLQQWNAFVASMLATGALVLSFILFLAGTKVYIGRSAGSINIFKLLINAYKVKKSNVRLRTTVHSFIDHANMEHEGGKFNINQINDVKQLWRICKVFLLMMPYWICYSQMDSNTFFLQGMYLRANFSPNSNNGEYCPNPRPHSPYTLFSELPNCNESNTPTSRVHDDTSGFPASSFSIFNSAFVVLLLPFMQIIYRAFSRCDVKVMVWKRLCIGMFLATFSLVAGATLEYFRLWDIVQCGFYFQRYGEKVYAAAPNISRFWQIPQYCLLGASEVFFVVTGIEYAYMESPQNMQGIVMGFFWFTEGIGYFIGAALSSIMWNGLDDINCNRVALFLYSLGLSLLLCTFCFIIIAVLADLGLRKVLDPRREFHSNELAESFPTTPQVTRRNRLDSGLQPLVDDDLMEY